MPIVRIEYEKESFATSEMQKIAEAVQGFVADATGYTPAEVSVFATENQLTVNAAPIEIYTYANFPDASEKDLEGMLSKLRDRVVTFKKENNIEIPFNLSIVKMDWKFQLEV